MILKIFVNLSCSGCGNTPPPPPVRKGQLVVPGRRMVDGGANALVPLRLRVRPASLLRPTETGIRSVPKFTANLYSICLSIDLRYTLADPVKICGNFWDTQ